MISFLYTNILFSLFIFFKFCKYIIKFFFLIPNLYSIHSLQMNHIGKLISRTASADSGRKRFPAIELRALELRSPGSVPRRHRALPSVLAVRRRPARRRLRPALLLDTPPRPETARVATPLRVRVLGRLRVSVVPVAGCSSSLLRAATSAYSRRPQRPQRPQRPRRPQRPQRPRRPRRDGSRRPRRTPRRRRRRNRSVSTRYLRRRLLGGRHQSAEARRRLAVHLRQRRAAQAHVARCRLLRNSRRAREVCVRAIFLAGRVNCWSTFSSIPNAFATMYILVKILRNKYISLYILSSIFSDIPSNFSKYKQI